MQCPPLNAFHLKSGLRLQGAKDMQQIRLTLKIQHFSSICRCFSLNVSTRAGIKAIEERKEVSQKIQLYLHYIVIARWHLQMENGARLRKDFVGQKTIQQEDCSLTEMIDI